ncbi:MAG: hypothetical protein ACRDQH_19110, partial [Pseudonocardiaceae bacterium]
PRAPVELIDRMMPEGSRPKPSQPPTRTAERGVSAVVVPPASSPGPPKRRHAVALEGLAGSQRHRPAVGRDSAVAATNPNPDRPDLAMEGAHTVPN